MSIPNEQPTMGPRKGAGADAADRLANQSQLDFDIAFFRRVLDREPAYVDVLRCQGQLLSRKGLHDEALAIDRRLVALRPGDGVAHYNLACSLALGGHPREAIAQLRVALERGYDDFEFLETDSDLDSVREHPLYNELMRRFGVSV